nr:hypothetical protein PU94_08275 [Coprobacter secundus]
MSIFYTCELLKIMTEDKESTLRTHFLKISFTFIIFASFSLISNGIPWIAILIALSILILSFTRFTFIGKINF